MNIELTEKELIELLHKATGNVKDFVMDNKGWLKENLPTNDNMFCTCGTEEYSEKKARKNGMWYCAKCKKPY